MRWVHTKISACLVYIYRPDHCSAAGRANMLAAILKFGPSSIFFDREDQTLGNLFKSFAAKRKSSITDGQLTFYTFMLSLSKWSPSSTHCPPLSPLVARSPNTSLMSIRGFTSTYMISLFTIFDYFQKMNFCHQCLIIPYYPRHH